MTIEKALEGLIWQGRSQGKALAGRGIIYKSNGHLTAIDIHGTNKYLSDIILPGELVDYNSNTLGVCFVTQNEEKLATAYQFKLQDKTISKILENFTIEQYVEETRLFPEGYTIRETTNDKTATYSTKYFDGRQFIIEAPKSKAWFGTSEAIIISENCFMATRNTQAPCLRAYYYDTRKPKIIHLFQEDEAVIASEISGGIAVRNGESIDLLSVNGECRTIACPRGKWSRYSKGVVIKSENENKAEFRFEPMTGSGDCIKLDENPSLWCPYG